MKAYLIDIDPRELRLPSSRRSGADPFKLHRQIGLFGASKTGMPPPWAYTAGDGLVVLLNGVTRATRIAKLVPGTMIQVLIVDQVRAPGGHLPKIGDMLP